MDTKKKPKKKVLNKTKKDEHTAVESTPKKSSDSNDVKKIDTPVPDNEDHTMELTSKEWLKFRSRLTQYLSKENKTKSLARFQSLLDDLELATGKDKKTCREALNKRFAAFGEKFPKQFKNLRKKLLDMRRKAQMSEIGVTKTVKAEFKEAYALAKSKSKKLKNHSEFVASLLEQSLY